VGAHSRTFGAGYAAPRHRLLAQVGNQYSFVHVEPGPSIQAPIAFLPPQGLPMSTIISILITFLVVILVLYLINMLPIDGRARQIARVIVIIIGIVSLLKYLAVF
jgi:hypothetical protein